MFDVADAPVSMKVEINHLDEGVMQKSYAGESCGGDNKSIAMRWSGAPSETKSFAVIFFDTESKADAGSVHWLAIDLPTDVTSLTSGASERLPGGAINLTQDNGKKAYEGPCTEGHTDGSGQHRFMAAVYALSVRKLNLEAGATPGKFREVIQSKTLAYGRAAALSPK